MGGVFELGGLRLSRLRFRVILLGVIDPLEGLENAAMEAESPPRWRWNESLRVVHETRGGESFATLHDPQRDEYFQLAAAAFELAYAFGAGADVETVRRSMASRGIEPPSSVDLSQFVTELADENILLPVGPAAAVARPTKAPRPPLWRRLLVIELAAIRPEAFFARLAPRLRFLFSAPSSLVIALLIVVAVVISLDARENLRAALTPRWDGRLLAGMWCIYAAIILVHEMAHGLACAHFGGRVGALGFLLLYGKPCAYCDVSAAWMLPKAARLWIMAAGSIAELGLWALATLTWRFSDPASLLHHLALMVMVIAGVGTLLNFNPLLKFDGYYMLSDLLEIPNLRQRAFAAIAAAIFRRQPEPAEKRERIVFWTYGVAAGAYTGLVVLWFLRAAFARFWQAWGAGGVVLLSGMLILLMIGPAAQLMRRDRLARR